MSRNGAREPAVPLLLNECRGASTAITMSDCIVHFLAEPSHSHWPLSGPKRNDENSQRSMRRLMNWSATIRLLIITAMSSKDELIEWVQLARAVTYHFTRDVKWTTIKRLPRRVSCFRYSIRLLSGSEQGLWGSPWNWWEPRGRRSSASLSVPEAAEPRRRAANRRHV